jgi:hypothetical protein
MIVVTGIRATPARRLSGPWWVPGRTCGPGAHRDPASPAPEPAVELPRWRSTARNTLWTVGILVVVPQGLVPIGFNLFGVDPQVKVWFAARYLPRTSKSRWRPASSPRACSPAALCLARPGTPLVRGQRHPSARQPLPQLAAITR